MTKAELLNRIEKINAGVASLATDSKIPAGSEKEVFLLLLEKAIKDDSFTRVFD